MGWSLHEKLKKFIKFIKKYDEESDEGPILDIEYPKNLHDLHRDLPFLPERMKINKCNKLVCNLYDFYVVHIKTLKQALNQGLVFKKSAQSNCI